MSLITRRVLVALLALGLTGGLAACGDDGDDDAGTDTASASGSEPADDESGDDAPGAGGDFCEDVQTLDEEMDAIDETIGNDPASSGRLFSEVAGRMDDIDAPEEISDDWDRLREAMGQISELFATIDFNDPESVAQLDDPALEEQFGDLEEVGDRIETFVQDECGIDLSGDDDSTETSDTTAG